MTDEAKPEPEERHDAKRSGTWAEDQRKRSYYYDDASGYEKFDPESEDDEPDAVGEENAEEDDGLT